MVPVDWLSSREASSATLSGVYCAVTDKESVATLRATFLRAALGYGMADLDAGAFRLSAPRALTQQIAAWLYDLHGPRNSSTACNSSPGTATTSPCGQSSSETTTTPSPPESPASAPPRCTWSTPTSSKPSDFTASPGRLQPQRRPNVVVPYDQR